MQEFLRNYYTILTFVVEAIAALSGIICFKKYKETPVKYFIYFLIYVCVCETLALYTLHVKDGVFSFLKDTLLEKNIWFTTLFWCIGSPVFYTFFYLKLISSGVIKRVIKVLLLLFLVYSFLCIAFNFYTFFDSYFISIIISGEFLILFLVSVYLYEMLQSDRIINFYKSVYFYISATIFMWLLVTTPILFYDIYYTTADWNFIVLKWQIFLFSNILMYLTFSFALLWCNPEKR
ncbi:hypothetical protein FNB79_08450 [Formosa sediminum]|uniref:Uncharacterized protein n=1 Tax=Formosa sediminum TaxID=2594004 RepID=A0A516GR65_9FLAO|nr:hypothetical protein [Formosa sediminum]QDO94011.1 hypothetical protein FNB79_08450 [Formosa sediminum]